MLSNARRCRFAVRRNASHNGVKLFLKLNSPLYQLSSILKDEKPLLITVFERYYACLIYIFWFEYEKKLIVFSIYPISIKWMKNFQKGFDTIVQFVQPGSHFEASNRQEGSPPFVSRGLYYT